MGMRPMHYSRMSWYAVRLIQARKSDPRMPMPTDLEARTAHRLRRRRGRENGNLTAHARSPPRFKWGECIASSVTAARYGCGMA